MRDASRPVIHAATAMFPAYSFHEAVRRIVDGVSEPLYGPTSPAQIQLCPHSFGHLTERACEELVAAYPGTSFRLHANARVLDRHHHLDASTFSADTRHYFEALADRSRRLGAQAYSLHAGYAANCDLSTMLDNVRRIQDIFGPSCVVAVEGLYPSQPRAQLMGTWRQYERVLASGTPMAIDLSHLHIVSRKEKSNGGDLLTALLRSDTTFEIHVSDNDGVRDSHARLERAPWWWSSLAAAGANAVVFSESNQVRDPSRLMPTRRAERA